MLKEALQWIQEQTAPTVAEIGGQQFSDRKLYAVDAMAHHPELETMHTTTLTSVVNFITSGIDANSDFPCGRIILHIMGPGRVLLTSEVTQTGKRRDRLIAEAQVDKFPFGQFMDREKFNIHLQTMFQKDENTAALLALIGGISDGTVTDGRDDGVTQRVTVRKGIQRVGSTDVPNPVVLTPFRTFPEAEQPASPFVFRLQPGRAEGDMPTCALFEADGSQWRNRAMSNVAAWLHNELPTALINSGAVVIIA